MCQTDYQHTNQETIILFNRAEDAATIFTYEKTWQKHLEEKLGLKAKMDNGFGGKEYGLPKSRVKQPRLPRRLSDSAKQKLAERLPKNRAHLSENIVSVVKQKGLNQNRASAMPQAFQRQNNASFPVVV